MQKYYDECESSIKVSEKFNYCKTTVLKYITTINRKKLTEEEKKKRRSKSVIDFRKRVKIELVNYKGGKCSKCGYKKCVAALEFHHKDPKEKDFTISGKSWSFDKLKKEVDKCIIVCSNCHKEIHHNIKNASVA